MNIGTIYIGRIKNASNFNVYVPSWKDAQKIPYTKYNIKETDFRIKTATFTSPQQLDLTTGQYTILINSEYHENFSGIILDSEYDEDTGLYTYQCQDWSRRYISKFELACKAPLYRILRFLITHGQLTTSRKATKNELAAVKNTLSGLRALDKYDQSLYKGNIFAGNPFSQTLTVMVRDKSWIETIRALVFNSLGYFDVWFNDKGIVQITPIGKTDWENTGLHLTDGGYYGRKFKFSTTNAITGVIVNGTDFTAGTAVKSSDVLGLDLTAFFGNVTTSVADPNQSNKNTSNAVKSTSSSKKTTTSSSSKTMKNPFNNKSKKIIVSADGGSDGFRKAIIKKLKADGWTVKDLGTGAGTHSKSYNILDKSYAVNLTIYNGADPATIAEPVTGWLKGKHEKYGVQLVQMWDTSTWTNPKGMKPYRYGNFNGYHCKKAWDDNYSSGKVDIADLGKWFKKYYPKTIHVCGPTVSDAYKQFKAGGYLKSKGLVK